MAGKIVCQHDEQRARFSSPALELAKNLLYLVVLLLEQIRRLHFELLCVPGQGAKGLPGYNPKITGCTPRGTRDEAPRLWRFCHPVAASPDDGGAAERRDKPTARQSAGVAG
ncbi:MAG: hypothetical protein QM820_40115 [Minicystis sp.]